MAILTAMKSSTATVAAASGYFHLYIYCLVSLHKILFVHFCVLYNIQFYRVALVIFAAEFADALLRRRSKAAIVGCGLVAGGGGAGQPHGRGASN